MTDKRSTDPRSTIALDLLTGGLRMGSAERRLDDPQDAEQVYAAYLSLLYAVRGARPGEELALRSADLEALLGIVGEDPDQIERRLVELMGCTAEEASLLRRVLLRHRAVAASVGVAAGLSLVAMVGPSVASADTPGATLPAPAPTASVAPLEQPPLTSYLTTDDGEHVPVPEDWDEAPAPSATAPSATAPSATAPSATAPSAPVPAATAAPALEVTAAAAPSTSRSAAPPAAPSGRPSAAVPVIPSSIAPSALPAPAEAPPAPPAPTTPPEAEVVLGEPMTPIDRPGEVVLGEPMTPIDRPGEVVLGEPMTPIDRPAADPAGEEPAPG